MQLRESLEREGYAVSPAVFSLAEIAALRQDLTIALAETHRPHNGGLCRTLDTRDHPLFRRLIDHRALSTLLHLAAAPSQPFLADNADLHAGLFHEWHTDFDVSTAQWLLGCETERLFKVGLYLQDHAGRDGLTLVPGSHRNLGTEAPPIHVDTRTGDVVLFDIRMRHAGRFPNRGERLLNTVAWQLQKHHVIDETRRHQLVWRVGRSLPRTRRQATRLAIFLTCGTSHALRERFMSWVTAGKAEELVTR